MVASMRACRAADSEGARKTTHIAPLGLIVALFIIITSMVMMMIIDTVTAARAQTL